MLDRHTYAVVASPTVKRTSLFLSQPQLDAFARLAKLVDRPSAELMREALDEYLRQRGLSRSQKAERPRAGTRKRS
jgi:hypothetical protein